MTEHKELVDRMKLVSHRACLGVWSDEKIATVRAATEDAAEGINYFPFNTINQRGSKRTNLLHRNWRHIIVVQVSVRRKLSLSDPSLVFNEVPGLSHRSHCKSPDAELTTQANA